MSESLLPCRMKPKARPCLIMAQGCSSFPGRQAERNMSEGLDPRRMKSKVKEQDPCASGLLDVHVKHPFTDGSQSSSKGKHGGYRGLTVIHVCKRPVWRVTVDLVHDGLDVNPFLGVSVRFERPVNGAVT